MEKLFQGVDGSKQGNMAGQGCWLGVAATAHSRRSLLLALLTFPCPCHRHCPLRLQESIELHAAAVQAAEVLLGADPGPHTQRLDRLAALLGELAADRGNPAGLVALISAVPCNSTTWRQQRGRPSVHCSH